MGLVFKSEEERNPTNQSNLAPLGHGGAESSTVSTNPCAAIQEERDLMNQFLEELGHAVTYDLWRSAKEEVEKLQQQYKETNGFEEVE